MLVQLLLIVFGSFAASLAGSHLNARLGLFGWSQILLPVFMVGIVSIASSGGWSVNQRLRRLEAEVRRLQAQLAEKAAAVRSDL